MNALSLKEKRSLLVRVIELYVFNGYDISDFVGKNYSYFNYDAIKNIISKLELNDE